MQYYSQGGAAGYVRLSFNTMSITIDDSGCALTILFLVTNRSCGTVHGDYDFIVAMSSSFGGYNQYCGRSVTIHSGGKSINAVVADT